MRAMRRLWVHFGLCLLYVPMTAWATWPLAAHPANHVLDAVRKSPFGLLSQADVLLHVWVLAWDTAALTTRPTALFDANLFHPARWTLARSEHMLGDIPLFAPVYLLSGNPVLAHQVTTLLAYVLSAVAAYAAAWHCVRQREAAFVAGALFALNPWQLSALPQLQSVSTMYLPLVLLFGMRLLHDGGGKVALAFVGAMVMQALCSAYLAAVTVALAVALLAGGDRQRLGRYLAAVAVALLAALAAHLPSAVLGHAGGVPTAGTAVAEAFSAKPLASYVPWMGQPGGDRPFLSAPALVLAVIGTAAPAAIFGDDAPRIRKLRRATLAAMAAGYLLSLGPSLRLPGGGVVPLPFSLLARVPGLAALRAPRRFGILVSLAASMLAGLGTAAVSLATRRRLAGTLVAAGALAVLAADVARQSFPLRPIETNADVPAVYRWLAEHGAGEPVLELPVGVDSMDWGAMYTQSRYAYLSSFHWSPLLNGYTAYPPDSFYLTMAIARRLPDRHALQDLVDLTGLHWLVLHRALTDSATLQAWQRAEGLTAAGRWGDDALFQVTLPVVRDLRPKLAWPSVETSTLNGVPVRALLADGMQGALRDLDLPAPLRPGSTAQGWVTVENGSDEPWPGFRPAPDGLVQIGYRWRDLADRAVAAPVRLSRIPIDVTPGARVRVPFAVEAPRESGRYRLHVTLVQTGGSWFDEHGG